MDIVDLGAIDEPDERRWPSSRLRPSFALVSAALLVLGFGLALASQVTAWFHFTANRSGRDVTFDDLGLTQHSVGMMDSNSLVALPYYSLWAVILIFCGAVVLATGNRQRMLFGAAAGALAAQAMLIVPVLHRPLLLLSPELEGDEDISKMFTFTHGPGTYFVVAALVVLSASMVVAVRGRVLPLPEKPRPRPEAPIDRDQPQPDTLRKPAELWPAQPAAPDPVDHSLYVRPTSLATTPEQPDGNESGYGDDPINASRYAHES